MASELKPTFLTINSMNPWTMHDSSSRGTMFSSSHIGQSLVVDGATPRRCQSGTEREFGKYTFKIKFPVDAQIIKVIPKFRRTIGVESINENPSSLVIYEDVATKEVGMLELIRNSVAIDNKHQHFGFKYKYNSVEEQLYAGAFIPKDTIVADSPNIDENGNYCYGVESLVAFMSVPGIIEDGVVVSESYLDKLTTRGFEKRVATWGKKYYPLNLYGDEKRYKPFPDIGEKVRDDGLLFALRSYDDLLGPIEMNPTSLMEPDYIFDKLVYAVPKATIVDINVIHADTTKVNPTPEGMENQTEKYYSALISYYTSIIEVYQSLLKSRKDALKITPEFHRMVVEAMSYVGFDNNPIVNSMRNKENLTKRKVQKLYRRNEIDDWRVEISFEYTVRPTIGFKLTDLHGGKGVICEVRHPDQMPVDKNGNRAEMIMDGDSTIKRMNFGRLYEHYINAASRDVSNKVRAMISDHSDNENYTRAWNYLTDYYKIVSPKMYELLVSKDHSDMRAHVDAVIKDGIYLWTPTDTPVGWLDITREVNKKFPPLMEPVIYEGFVTEKPVLISSMYIILLEKTGSGWSGVSSAKLQHFGIPARVSNTDKHSSPGRNQPVRILGEAEVRLLNAVVGSDVTVDLLDQSNSPATHKAIVNNILMSNTPTNIERIVDRRKIPLGNSRPLLFVKHILECAGIRFVREMDDPIRIQEVEEKTKKMRKG